MTTSQATESETGLPAGDTKLDDPSLYFNRELSWIAFNERVLELSEDESVPLLERLKFAAIFSSNLDEYFMVRVAGLLDQIDAGLDRPGYAGLNPRQTLAAIRERVLVLSRRQTDCAENRLFPALADRGIRIATVSDVTPEERAALRERFRRVIFPALTPLAVGPGQPFPYISNLSLSLGVIVGDPVSGHTTSPRDKVPIDILPRYGAVGDTTTFVPLEDVIADNLDSLFQGMDIIDYAVFRVSRDADLSVSDEAEDLMRAVEDELRRRRFGEVVRVEVGADMSPALLGELMAALDVDESGIYPIDGRLDLTGLWQLVRLPGHAKLRDESWTGRVHPRFRAEDGRPDVMEAMRRGDILVHHPYDSFTSSVGRFIEQAVADPNVLAIKQTVYRTSDDSPLVPALIRAAEQGKQAVCLVELQARFDERTNIVWAKALEQAGVHVVYGHPALKTHAKCVLVVRREGDGVRNYVHIGTGNYHSTTARLYTDFGLFTTDPELGQDVAELFNYLTGFGRPSSYRKALVAPSHLRDGILDQITETIDAHSEETPSRIVIKLNSLVDQRCIEALYEASRAGVKVDLNVRGICCLRPGIPGISENIEVVSIVGRFLEHSRVFAFERGGEAKVFMGSADLMPRNLDTRVELVVPLDQEDVRTEMLAAVELCLADTRNAWELRADGEWERRVPVDDDVHDAQAELMRRHAARADEFSPAD
ncbi:MAG: polyphosphate kinase [Solirubrobacteraceae bacterium]|nr:polyphosphate kinase [Solirubrobacteraceae bacterium]